MQVPVEVREVHEIAFPCCPSARKHVVTHIKPGEGAGPWGCDGCGREYNLRRSERGHVIELEPRNVWREKTLVVVELKAPLRLVVEHSRWVGEGPDCVPRGVITDEERGHNQYYYEEHTCPTNWIDRDVVQVIDPEQPGDPDPHGCVRYVNTVIRPPGWDEDAWHEDLATAPVWRG